MLQAIACVSLSAEEISEQGEDAIARVKTHLMREFTAIDDTERSSAAWIKHNLGANDEQIRKVMMAIYSEAALTYSNTPDKEGRSLSRMRLEGAIRELWGCADSQTKDFLLGYAASEKNDSWLRQTAILSYLRVADAEEAKDALLRFLVGENRMGSQARSSICQDARTAFMEADARKRSAILESLYVALAKEDNKWLFRVYDTILCELSHHYADSHQRLAILLRLINAPSLCKGDETAMPWLLEQQKVLQKKRLTTNINTNLAVLESTDFSLPQSDLPADVAAEAVRGRAGPEAQTAEAAGRGPGRYAVFVLLALFLLGFGAWRLMRR